MGETLEQLLREKLECVNRRLEALDEMEAKLEVMHRLAEYAASGRISEPGLTKLQEWMDIMQAEVQALDRDSDPDQKLTGALAE